MMATNSELRAGVATALRTIADLQVYERPPGEIVTDAAVVRRRGTNYDVTLDGLDDTTWGITVFVSFANTDAGAESLDDYVSQTGPKSIVAAIEDDPTLGGIVSYCHVANAEGEKVTNYAGTDYLTVDFNLEIGD
ncbi:hypothetical protein [Kribbella sp. NPDC050470]|uniref:hypothetical protein n=1 Tax=unclassified Kribbella TaxID=2644121 RepID=UPI003797AD9A